MSSKVKIRRAQVILIATLLLIFTAAAYEFGRVFELEYPFTLTLWMAKQTKIPNGERVTDLIRSRSGNSYVEQHWHHCTWCDVVYPHALHMAVKVSINNDERDFYLFDWDSGKGRLLPITIHTAKIFPELIPNGCLVEPLGVGLNPQLYRNDEPCRITFQTAQK